MRFATVVEAFEKLEEITSRTQMTVVLVELFKKTSPDVMDKVIYMMLGKLWPDWKGMPELGVGEKLLIKAISIATHVPERRVEDLLKRFGDAGRVAESLKGSKPGGPGLMAFLGGVRKEALTVDRVYSTLVRIALAQGEGSRDVKLKLLAGLIAEAEPTEAKYIVRFVEGRLRLGVGEATIMDALAIAYGGGAFARPIIERAYNLRADLGEIAKILCEKGLEELKAITPLVGVPIRPMLAERLNDPEEILKKVAGRALVEYKYDGERAQIHKKGDTVLIFSRRLENITHMYPDVVSYARSGIKASEAIVEGEIVAYDPESGELRPFQELMHRRRKHDVHVAMKEYPVKVFLFDALYVDGKDLTNRPLPERRKVLEEIIEPQDNWRIADYVEADDPSELESFFLKAVEEGAEGVVVKAVHSGAVYQAGARGWLWIKYKRDYKSEMMDTVDLVAVGAFYGRGKRAGKYGALLMASYDPATDTFKTVCKVGSGFTDEELERMTEIFKDLVIPHKHPRVVSKMEPDVWFVPQVVAEIIGAELTLSPMHTCGLDKVKPGVGISIRFPRFIRWREDKGPEDATTEDELVEMYRKQLRKVAEETGAT